MSGRTKYERESFMLSRQLGIATTCLDRITRLIDSSPAVKAVAQKALDDIRRLETSYNHRGKMLVREG